MMMMITEAEVRGMQVEAEAVEPHGTEEVTIGAAREQAEVRGMEVAAKAVEPRGAEEAEAKAKAKRRLTIGADQGLTQAGLGGAGGEDTDRKIKEDRGKVEVEVAESRGPRHLDPWYGVLTAACALLARVSEQRHDQRLVLRLPVQVEDH